MFHTHQFHGLRHTSGFEGVCLKGFSRGHIAKPTTAGANVAQNHEGRRSFSPALSHVRAMSTLANGVQFVLVHQGPNLSVAFACWQLNPQPFGLGHPYIGAQTRFVFFRQILRHGLSFIALLGTESIGPPFSNLNPRKQCDKYEAILFISIGNDFRLPQEPIDGGTDTE